MTNWTEAQIDRHLRLWTEKLGPDSPEASIVRQLRAERDAARADSAEPHTCSCGTAMSKNPHPDSGKPFSLLEVGPVWVCVPCSSSKIHAWATRARVAEAKLNKIAALTATQENSHE